MKFCTSCGENLIHIEKIFCPNCGAKMNVEVKSTDIQKQSMCNGQPAPGRIFLHVMGILYILRGSLAIIALGLTMFDGDGLEMTIMSGISWYVYRIFLLLSAFFHVSIGIIAIKKRNLLEKAALLRTLGFIDIGISAINKALIVILFSVSIGNAFFNFINASIFSILYLVGACKNLKAYRNRSN